MEQHCTRHATRLVFVFGSRRLRIFTEYLALCAWRCGASCVAGMWLLRTVHGGVRTFTHVTDPRLSHTKTRNNGRKARQAKRLKAEARTAAQINPEQANKHI